jgi:hypothetical protein
VSKATIFGVETEEDRRRSVNKMISRILVLAHEPSVSAEDADKLRLAADVLGEVSLRSAGGAR